MPAQERFASSRHGFAFSNAWPSEPAVTVASPFGRINVGNAEGGLCGGMVFAVVDYWHAATVPPAVRPAPGDPLYRYIVRRLIDSWHVPAGIAQYFQWMNLPDADTGFDILRRHVVIERGLAWRTIRVQWPQIKADLDRGTPAALGLVTVASSKPADLALNHQVLAYAYDQTGTAVSVRVYDPNRGQRDDIWIRFDTSTPTKATTFAHNLGIGHRVRGFFRTAYTPSTPPAADPKHDSQPATA
jgi:hypothetical protein